MAAGFGQGEIGQPPLEAGAGSPDGADEDCGGPGSGNETATMHWALPQPG